MRQLVECVLNASEGRNQSILKEIGAAIQSVPGCRLLDCSSDADHHRSVFTFVGDLEAVGRAAYAAVEAGLRYIDLRKHCGIHPRLGAIDLVPFVPLQGVSMDDCVKLAHRLGGQVHSRLALPVYFYGEAALTSERKDLPRLRRGGFEQILRDSLEDPALRPDLGGPALHPSGGAVIIGARPILIAFNVFLETADVAVARSIARLIRESGGGLPAVRALGLYLPQRDQAQVSMNLLDYRRTSPQQVFDRIALEAIRLGTQVHSSQIIGLIPLAALPPCPQESLRLEEWGPWKILENRIEEVQAHEP